jgi:hypothetical protein
MERPVASASESRRRSIVCSVAGPLIGHLRRLADTLAAVIIFVLFAAFGHDLPLTINDPLFDLRD